MQIEIPDPCIVMLVGAGGVGKTTFARRHFKQTEVLSSDRFRAMVSDSEADMAATVDAFELLYTVIGMRLSRRRLCVFDATNVTRDTRRRCLKIAKDIGDTPVVAIVFDLPLEVCLDQNAGRVERILAQEIVAQQYADLQKHRGTLEEEGVSQVYTLSTHEEVESVAIARNRSWAGKLAVAAG